MKGLCVYNIVMFKAGSPTQASPHSVASPSVNKKSKPDKSVEIAASDEENKGGDDEKKDPPPADERDQNEP